MRTLPCLTAPDWGTLILALVCFCTATTEVTAIDAYLVAGQSNGWRLSQLRHGDRSQTTPGRIYYFGMECVSEPESSQLVTLSHVSANSMGKGLADSLRERAKGGDIVFVQYCRCGASVLGKSPESWWPGEQPGSGKSYDEGLFGTFAKYLESVRIQVKEKTGEEPVFKGIFWHQGESDARSDKAIFEKAVTNVFHRLRAMLGDSHLPIVAGHIRDLGEGPAGVNAVLDRIAAADENIATVPLDGLQFERDRDGKPDVHVARPGCHELGRRLVAKWVELIATGKDANNSVERVIDRYPLSRVIRTAIGVTRQGSAIPCFIAEDHHDPKTKKFRILLIGGLGGTMDSVEEAMSAFSRFQFETELQKRYTVSCVPCARPDAVVESGLSELSFPPKGNAYNQAENDEAHYLWRWVGMHAPDLVIDLRTGSDAAWIYPDNPAAMLQKIRNGLSGVSQETAGEGSLVTALNQNSPSEMGSIPALQASGKSPLLAMTTALNGYFDSPAASEARHEFNRRIARSPIEVAQELADVYGGKLEGVMYIPSLAVIGRMRLGELTGNKHRLREAEQLAAPFRSGDKASMPANGNGSTLSGHLVFSELARRTGDDSWAALAKKAADYGFDANGQPKESMPFHYEMSDSVFMGCAILAEVGALTGDPKYFEQCLRHLKFMQKLCLRDDGIYRHSPLDEAAWGRGNGFPALGMALSLSALPEDSEAFAFFLKSYRAHLKALAEHQDSTGAWHQVIDRTESYREFTSTCMITFAIVRGLRRGWLEEKQWEPVVKSSWRAIKSRIGPRGRLVDVCTGTGKQKNLRAYYDRTAILGPDARGGAMGLLVSTEIAFWNKERGSL